ncbi:hypothetical protein Asfd1_168 [Aeromonas phage Asfd_1]|nr:hypothetical protein Asfd1_168 [Aeromonas phage Asfd_1]
MHQYHLFVIAERPFVDAIDTEFSRIHYVNGNTLSFDILWDSEMEMTVYHLTHSSGAGFQSYDFNDILAYEGEI